MQESSIGPAVSQAEQHEVGLSGLLGPGALARVVERIGERRAVVTCLALDGRTATLWLNDGLLFDVESEGHKGTRALVRALALQDGSFEVRIEPHEAADQFQRAAAELLSEVQPKADRWHAAVEALRGLDALYEVSFTAVAQRLGEIPDAANLVLRLIDGQRRVRSLLETAPFEDELETLRHVLLLRDLGVLVRTEVTPPASWIPSDSDAQIPMVEAMPLPGIPIDWAEVTLPSAPIPVYRFPPTSHGERKRRMEDAQSALLQKLAEKSDRPILLTHEVLAPGAVIPADFDARFVELATAPSAPAVAAPAPGERRRKLAVIVLVALVGGVSGGLLLFHWLRAAA